MKTQQVIIQQSNAYYFQKAVQEYLNKGYRFVPTSMIVSETGLVCVVEIDVE